MTSLRAVGIAAAISAISATAGAKPRELSPDGTNKVKLPSGLVIEAGGRGVYVDRDKDSGSLLEPTDSYDTGCRDGAGLPCSFWLKSVTLADDGSISVRASYGDESTQIVSFTPAQLDARLEVTRAWKLAKAKRWADAETTAAHALALEPGSLPVTLALVRYRMQQAKPSAALLQPFVAARAVEVYAAVFDDPLLAPLVDAPELAGLRATTKGTATVTKRGGLSGHAGLAYSPERDALAVVHFVKSGEGMDTYSELELRDPRTGALLVSQSIDSKAGEQTASRLLADLGFGVPTGVESADEAQGDPDRPQLSKMSLPKAHFGIVGDEQHIRVFQKNLLLGQCTAEFSHLDWAEYAPSAHVVVTQWTLYKRMSLDPSGVCIVRVP